MIYTYMVYKVCNIMYVYIYIIILYYIILYIIYYNNIMLQ